MCAFVGTLFPVGVKTFCSKRATPHDLPNPELPNIAKWLAKKY